MNKAFDFKVLDKASTSEYKVNVIVTDHTVHKAELWKKEKAFLLWGTKWVFVADLYDPVRAVEIEIEKTQRKLKELELKKESELASFGARVQTFGDIYGNPVSLDPKKKAAKLDGQVGPKSKDDKPKTRKESFTLHQVPDANKGQQNGRKNQN